MRYETMASMIKLARLGKGYTQAYVAKKLKCNAQFISNVERGICPLPVRKMRGFEELTGMSKDALFDAFVKDLKKIWEVE